MITAASQHLQRSWSVAFWQRSWSDDAVVDQLHVVPCCIHFFDELQQVEAFAGGVSDGSLPTLGSATASTTSWSWFTRGAADCSWWVLFDYSWNLNWMPMTYDTLWHLLTSYDILWLMNLWQYDDSVYCFQSTFAHASASMVSRPASRLGWRFFSRTSTLARHEAKSICWIHRRLWSPLM